MAEGDDTVEADVNANINANVKANAYAEREAAHVAQFPIQLVYAPAAPAEPIMETMTVAANTSIAEALHRSAFASKIPGMDLTACRVGVWGKLQELDTLVTAHARIEIYRPLVADPKESRRQRAGKV